MASMGMIIMKRPKNMATAERVVVPVGVGVEAGECGAVVAGGGGVGVEDFAEAVRSVVGEAGEAKVGHQHGDGGETEDEASGKMSR